MHSEHSQDIEMMALAIRLAEQGLYTTDPNPRVGAVIVHSGAILGQGWHQFAGEPHAEVHALAQAGVRAQGATAYVTLEPCAHYGKTPPCADALIKAGVSRVVYASRDPNPLVSGKGADKLRAAGIQVEQGLLDAQARVLNPGFFSRFERQRPFIRLKVAISVDGRTAMASGESQWITGAAARADVQRLRARSSAIVTGAGTLREDDPLLTVRPESFSADPSLLARIAKKAQPDCYVVAGALPVPVDARVWQVSRRNWLVLPEGNNQGFPRDFPGETLLLPGSNRRVSLPDLVAHWQQVGCNEVLVEAGAGLAGAFLQSGLVDELWVYMAPVLLGSSARPLADWSIGSMADKQMLKLKDMRMIGDDIRLIYRPCGNKGSE